MGATTPTISLVSDNGQTVTLSGYCAGADAVGYVIPTQAVGTASANSGQDFVLPPGIWHIQYMTGPATGRVRLWCNGSPGPTAIDLATVIAMVASGNKYGAFRGGKDFRYSLVVDATLAA